MRVTCESSEKCVQHHNLLNGGVSRFAKRFYDLGLDGRSLCPFKTATARLALASTLGTISLDRPREITHTHACRLLYSLEQGQAQFAKLSLSDTPQLVLFLLGISRRLSDDNSPILCARAHTHTHTHTHKGLSIPQQENRVCMTCTKMRRLTFSKLQSCQWFK